MKIEKIVVDQEEARNPRKVQDHLEVVVAVANRHQAHDRKNLIAKVLKSLVNLRVRLLKQQDSNMVQSTYKSSSLEPHLTL